MPTTVKNLTIGVDARELLGRPTGVGRYLARLLQCWTGADADQGHRFLLLTPRAEEEVLRWQGPRAAVRVVPGPAGTRWEQLHLRQTLAVAGIDVLFSPAYTAPLATRVRRVVTIHDLAFFRHPGDFPWRQRLRRRWLTRASAAVAARVLTDSRFGHDEIVALLGTPPERISVIPLGVDPSPASATGGGREPLVLFAGSIFRRRNLPQTIRAFARVAATHPELRLEIVGEDRSVQAVDLAAVARQVGVAEQVRLRSFVADGELAQLLSRAAAFVFLSRYEGFALTPLEALAAGVPVVLGDTPVAREVYGEAAHCVPPDDEEAAAAALEAVLFDDAVRRRQLAAGASLVLRHGWGETARRTLGAIEEAARG